ncbi:DNA polymerase III subunit delta [Helicobacter valdiviensis]|uniref:DNA polymerase III subunit delta n=1 Tax=Helicobacter valdiviensis TaxID=1458358 RepID=A0A2W6MWR1_9HELI|nr:DNA polymerase III subunit delta [Helicobacter valdiviensis]PZT48772.1 DNA polymerase III subunit delta [Helicobacter valdiviensis]
MYKKELDTKLKNNSLIRAIFLYGQESFLPGFYGQKIANTLLEKGVQKNIFYFGEYDYENALSCFTQGSLFGDENLVWIKCDKKIPKKQLDSLIESILKAQSGYLIVEFYQAENKTQAEYAQDCRAMAGSFKGKDVYEARFFLPSPYEALEILREFAHKFSIQITDFLLRKILEEQNNSLALTIAELQKYSIFEGEIDSNLVQNLGYGLGSIDYEEILDALVFKKPFLKTLKGFLEQGYEEISLLNDMQKYFFTHFLFFSHIKLYGNATSEEVLGYKLPPALLEKRKKIAIMIKQDQYEKILYTLNARREEAIKGINKDNGLLNTLIKLEEILR